MGGYRLLIVTGDKIMAVGRKDRQTCTTRSARAKNGVSVGGVQDYNAFQSNKIYTYQ